MRGYLRLGEAAFSAGRYAEAESWFEKALAERPGHDVAANLAAAEQAQGKHAEAASHFALALRSFPPTAAPERKQPLEQSFAESRAKVGALRVRVSADGADIVVGGKPVAKSPATELLFVEPGTVSLEARLGSTSATASVSVEAGGERTVELALSPPVGDGSGTEPLPLWPVGLGAGLTAASVAVGIVLHVVAAGQLSDADTSRDELRDSLRQGGARCPGAAGCAELEQSYRDADTSANAGTGLLVAGGVLGVATIVYLAVALGSDATDAEPTAEATTARLEPLATFGPELSSVGLRIRY